MFKAYFQGLFYDGLLYDNPYLHWVVCHPPKKNMGPFFIAQFGFWWEFLGIDISPHRHQGSTSVIFRRPKFLGNFRQNIENRGAKF